MTTEEAPNVLVAPKTLPDDPEAPHIRQYDNDTAAGEPSPFKRREGEHPWFSKRVLIGAALMVVLGIIEGGCFVASGAFSPVSIRYQMVFKIWIILKLFISAVGSSMVCQGIFALIKPAWFNSSRFYEQSSVGYPRAIAGSLILGVGMTLSGSGPTLIPSQIGAGVWKALYTIAGMFIGSLIYAMIEPLVLRINLAKAAGEKTTVDELFGGTYSRWAVAMGVFCLGLSLALEFIVPHSDDKNKIGTNGKSPMYPTIAGCVMGMIQVPVRIITNDGLGGSTWYMGVWATLSCGKISPRHRFDSMEKVYQMIYMVVGTTLGAVIMSQSLNGFDAPTGYPVQQTLTGGICMVFGGRLANGCTCGHGISGASELSLQSFVAAGCIFAGAIACGYFLYGIDVVEL